jgi:hypothetical protein
MKKSGKILFFNSSEGHGIIITAEKEKIHFKIEEWDDFNTMPSLGLEVVFDFEDSTALHIVCKPDNYNESLEDKDAVSVENKEDVSENEMKQEESSFENESDKAQEDDSRDNSQESEASPSQKDLFKEIGEITVITEKEEEPQRGDNVTLSLNVNNAVHNYFKTIEEHINERTKYQNVTGRLDYMITRRFLWTMFNNLSEIDIHIITPQIRTLSKDIKLTANIYDDLLKKTKYPALAYEEVFLSCQSEYMKIKDGAEEMIQKLSRLRTDEKHVGSILKVKKEEVANDINTKEFDLLTNELKSLNGAYVDIVHMMAELDERYKSDLEQLLEFEKEYKNDFNELFAQAANKYKAQLADILAAQAFLLDMKLWQEVKTSKAVKAYFKKSSISGELNTKTYLKYFLDSLDETKALEENKKLFDLYEYLVSIHTDYIIIVTSSTTEALDYEAGLRHLPKGHKAKAFVNEKKALKWAIHHNVKILILEDTLQIMDANTFLKYYDKYVLSSAKVILLGNKPKNSIIPITKLLSKGVTPRVISKNVDELLQEK